MCTDENKKYSMKKDTNDKCTTFLCIPMSCVILGCFFNPVGGRPRYSRYTKTGKIFFCGTRTSRKPAIE